MCGIAGFISFTQSFAEADLKAMTSCISHRGPDAEGFFFDGKAGMGHRRLSILDLSDAANQPMFSDDERYTIIYNGEVYNFKEIALSLNVNLRTTSDTEVILQAFIRKGPDFVHELNGMFAFAIYDKKDELLYLYRDRIGIKPIYYSFQQNSFAFSSELKSLAKNSILGSKLTLNKEAVSQFLYLGYIPRPNSIYNEIKKMDSGTYYIVGKDRFEEKKYWSLENQIEKEVVTDFEQAKVKLKDLITSSVKYRMISDVPFGTFLSGGIDSSLVTAVAQSLSDTKIKTFSIAFNDSKHNEAQFARAVSEHLSTDHHEFNISYKEAIEWVPKLTEIYDEPFADSSAIPTLIVSEMARKHVTMTLSGDGGDELFLGYGMYNWAERMANPVVRALRNPLSRALSLMGNRYERVSWLFKYPNPKKIKSHIFSQEQYLFSEEEIRKLMRPEYFREPIIVEDKFNLARPLNAMEQQALFDMDYYLQDDLLVKVDRASMHHALETRVPLLDYRIIKFALNLSPNLRYNKGVSKYLLKEVLYDFVPREIFDRPKWGFSIPLGKWLKKELRYLIDDFLNKEIVERLGVVHFSYVETLLREFLNGKDYLYNRVWLLVVLHKWLEDYKQLLNPQEQQGAGL